MNQRQTRFFATWLVIAITCTLPRSFGAAPDEPSLPRDEIFDPEHLLDIRIEVAEKDWNILRHQTRSLVGALAENRDWDSPFEYVPANVTIDGQLIKNVGIRKKGFLGSLDNHRPSLKIRFNKYDEEQTPYGDLDRLTLNNNKQDPSKLSQYLSYRLFRRAGLPASRCNFAKVSVNGKELGIYSNVEAIKPPMLTHAFGDGSGLLYEGTVTDFIPGAEDRFEPKTKKSNLAPLKQITRLVNADQLDVEELNQLVDVESFLRFWAVESVIGFWDGYTHNQNNYYLYRNPTDSKFYFLPWGTDSAFTNFVPPIIDKIANRSFHANATLANRLYRTTNTRKKYLQTLRDVLAKEWNEEDLLDEIERVHAMLKDSVQDRAEFEKSVVRVKAFVRDRRSTLEEELGQWPIPLRHGPRQPGFTRMLGEVTASFETKWSTPFPFQNGFQGEAQIDFMVDGTRVELSAPTASASPQKDKGPTIRLSATRDSDERPLSFYLTFSPADFQPAETPVPFMGLFMEGSMITFLTMMSNNPSAIKLIDGTATLEQASTEKDAAVKGVANFRIMQFAGGKKSRIDWEGEVESQAQD